MKYRQNIFEELEKKGERNQSTYDTLLKKRKESPIYFKQGEIEETHDISHVFVSYCFGCPGAAMFFNSNTVEAPRDGGVRNK